MERAQARRQLYDGVAASSGIVLNRYSFLLLERDDDGWAATLIDADGKTISRCRSRRTQGVACSFPGP
jgi:hypothetical protein